MPSSLHSPFRGLSRFERLTLAHVAILLVATTWGFGGNALWLRPTLAWWGSLSILITLSAILGRSESPLDLRPLRWLWPFVLFNGVVLVSLWTPGFREVRSGPDTMMLARSVPAWVPSAAVPAEARRALWLFDALYLSCFNVAFVLKRRRAVRGLVLIAMANALALAVFGTLQKLAGADGLYFGRVRMRQQYFFSTFIYHNHWAAFALLMAAAGLGLAWRYNQRAGERGFLYTPGFAALVTVFLLAVTEPLSASRSGVILMAALLLAAFLQLILRVSRRRRRDGASAAAPLAGAALVLVLALAGIWYVAGDTIERRAVLTGQQLAVMRAEGTIGARMALYRDTWRMGRDRPWFGWGMASFPYAFMLYNTQEPDRRDRLPIFYSAAHDDWLESFAEHGVIGSLLLAGCGLAPLFGLRRSQLANPLTRYLLAGCALVLAYAWVEFPFGNIAVVLSWWLCYFCAVRYAYLHAGAPPAPGQ